MIKKQVNEGNISFLMMMTLDMMVVLYVFVLKLTGLPAGLLATALRQSA